MDIAETRDRLRRSMVKGFDEANQLWFEMLRLIITLSSSCLLITLALVDKLFPNIQTLNNLSAYLIISWVLFFCAIVFALIAKANEIIFQGNSAREFAIKLKELDLLIEKGENPISLKPLPYYYSNTIYWGVLAFDAFLLAILALCLAFLETIASSLLCSIILSVGVFLLILLNIHLIKKRKK